MILILAEEGTEPIGRTIADALTQEYNLPCAPEVVAAGAVWDRPIEWDDLLLVIYKSGALPEPAVKYIQAYRDAHKPAPMIMPVSTNAGFRKPPEPVSGIKAAEYDGTPDAVRRIVKAAGVFLGLALRPGRQQIFVSYRASDGSELAQALHGRLRAEGFEPWLDVAEENIAIGDEVQERIRQNVEKAAMILLVDTPDAPESKWVSAEIDMAIAQLIPVLPVVASGERTSRFIPLQSLRRQALVKQNGLDGTPLSDEDWAAVRKEIDEVLLCVYRRRLRILTRAQAAFEEVGYKWQVIDDRLRMYRADKQKALVPRVIVLSHCSVHDVTYLPAL